eukprot:15462678-Alexandrium_andersonii.AAC.1
MQLARRSTHVPVVFAGDLNWQTKHFRLVTGEWRLAEAVPSTLGPSSQAAPTRCLASGCAPRVVRAIPVPG